MLQIHSIYGGGGGEGVAQTEEDEEKKEVEQEAAVYSTWTVPACPCVSWPAASCATDSHHLQRRSGGL